ncbi:unnamed protein product [Vitrella brassicaformis CCMP3155]|uniref:Uncharacterized protein n=1 Tax=Vitrella brassicaformis (strain CCMP3155) TaxID=1169540 RepID=A0A0G4FXH3_VITBC|nr:unnamed protein product [Vitrella brassicaformis CCMP3155]|eukprot:CEM20109.1 unnamed protein product [Vitrella brassicaformis CCMP3155]
MHAKQRHCKEDRRRSVTTYDLFTFRLPDARIQEYKIGTENFSPFKTPGVREGEEGLGRLQYLMQQRRSNQTPSQRLPSGLEVLGCFWTDHAFISGMISGTIEPPRLLAP